MSNQVENCSSLMDTLWNAGKGAALGAAVVTGVTPLLYAKNRWQTQQKFVLGNCMRGAPLLAVNVVPQAAITIAVNEFIKKQVFKKEDLTTSEELLAAGCAGGFAGIVSTPAEFVVQNYQNGWQKTMKKVALSAYKEKGVPVFMNAWKELALRESKYSVGYLVVSRKFSQHLEPYVKNKYGRFALASAGVGVIMGTVTSPPDTLRANKQWMERNWTAVQTFRNLGFSKMFDGASARIAAVGVATFIMTAGKDYLERD